MRFLLKFIIFIFVAVWSNLVLAADSSTYIKSFKCYCQHLAIKTIKCNDAFKILRWIRCFSLLSVITEESNFSPQTVCWIYLQIRLFCCRINNLKLNWFVFFFIKEFNLMDKFRADDVSKARKKRYIKSDKLLANLN